MPRGIINSKHTLQSSFISAAGGPCMANKISLKSTINQLLTRNIIFMNLSFYYSCIVLMSICVSVCLSSCVHVCVCVCVHDNLKNNGSVHLKLEHIVVYENSSDEFDIGHCPIKVKVTA